VRPNGGYFPAANEFALGVKFFLKAGSKINESGWRHQTALCHASKNGHEYVLKLLLLNGAEANKVVVNAFTNQNSILISNENRGISLKGSSG
jgi:ankyrin repeat protein